jgi:hypothetical protein
MGSPEKAVVTTGGTKERLDNIRYLTNFSTGKFGYAIANDLKKSGYDVTVMCPKEAPLLAGYTISGINHQNFTDTESLQDMLLNQQNPDIIFHAAAVSDFKPKNRINGKIKSSHGPFMIEFIDTPKILPKLREKYGNKAFLVGFKLLSRVKRQILIDAALKQNKNDHLNLTVANDDKNLQKGMHPVILVTAEGGAIDLFGTREEVSKNIVEFVKKRSRVNWYHTEKSSIPPEITGEEKAKFSKLLKFAQQTNLLCDTNGNASMRYGDFIIATPRQVDKGKTTVDEAAVALVDHKNSSIYYKGKIKSSIDTGVSDALYRYFPNIKYLLHFHSQWGKASRITSFPQPCGSKEEVGEILRQVGGDPSIKEFAVELLHHGYLIGLPEDGIERLQSELNKTLAGYKEHLVEIHREEELKKMIIRPLFSDSKIVGILSDHSYGEVAYLTPEARGLGIGQKIASQLIERQKPISTVDECGVLSYYKKFGFEGKKNPETGFYTLYPPKIVVSDSLFEKVDEWKVK